MLRFLPAGFALISLCVGGESIGETEFPRHGDFMDSPNTVLILTLYISVPYALFMKIV